MPMYDFECPKCSLEETRICKVDERKNQLCSKCAAGPLKQLLNGSYKINIPGCIQEKITGTRYN